MHKSSFQTMVKFKNCYLNKESNLRILDIGSYDSSGTNYNYGRFLREKNWQYRGMDIHEGPNVDIVVSDIYNWVEIEDESYDIVISGQAFEHMEFFWMTIKEVERILKPGGFCCIIAPSSGPVHKNPFDCFRFKDDGMRAIADYAGLEVIECYTNEDEISNPWYDSVLIAKKPYSIKDNSLDRRMDNLEKKLDLILKEINK
ncbi:class I SAM-dependent methyltransferase [Methanobrevibacter woesei]|uniref:class I SAM-dependent methyltransferase n=1 Tax=Methanobrevibacter woesei TaxID=190976 RepID=UPI00320A7E3C